jgi:hypothetical protein
MKVISDTLHLASPYSNSGMVIMCTGDKRVVKNGLIAVNRGCLKKELCTVLECYCVASVTKTFTLKGVQIIHLWNHNYPR